MKTTLTAPLVVAVIAMIAFVILAVFGTLTSTDAAGLIGGIIAGFGLGNSHANTGA